MARFVCLSLILISLQVSAEYRVFKLKVMNTKTNAVRTVHSTLDWRQYHDYNYLKPEEVVRLEDTWMCWKRHQAFKPLCKRPVTSESLKAKEEAGP